MIWRSYATQDERANADHMHREAKRLLKQRAKIVKRANNRAIMDRDKPAAAQNLSRKRREEARA